jgi:tRNA (guanine37-N1)-methyltransferase
MLKFDVITLFPQIFSEHLNNLPFKKALEKNIAEYNLWDLKKYSVNKYGSVDDKTYGGGVGMILMVEPIFKALEDIYGPKKAKEIISNKEKREVKHRIIVLSPRGETYTQIKAREFSECSQITLICGRYEGIDARVEDNIATDVISIGDFVLSGGEIPALTIMESVTRILPGILEKKQASEIESYSKVTGGIGKYVEYPQYTKPENFMGFRVPDVLLSGNHAKIDKWRKENSHKNQQSDRLK